MARTNTKAAVLDEDEAVETEQTPKQVINEGITRFVEATGIDVQKSRYKAMRAIAFQAFSEAIEAGDFDRLVDEALANVDSLPSGWEIERAEADEKPAPKAKAPARAPAKKPAAAKSSAATKTPGRRRPTR